MTKKLYVGNLPFSSTEDDIRELFEQYGAVHSVRIITDRDTGRSKGFGFVEMDDDQIDNAVSTLNGAEFGGRTLKIDEARERQPRRQKRW